jgi:hypothetical protein
MRIIKIVSGGQTGADRAALDAAIDCGVPHGGWCPKGRRAEDGPISDRYHLQETESEWYPERTRANVADSDGTLIFSHGPLTGGSLLTKQFAKELGKPCVHIDLNDGFPVDSVQDGHSLEKMFPNLGSLKIRLSRGGKMLGEDGWVLNVAGPRESTDPQIYDAVYERMTLLLQDQSSLTNLGD